MKTSLILLLATVVPFGWIVLGAILVWRFVPLHQVRNSLLKFSFWRSGKALANELPPSHQSLLDKVCTNVSDFFCNTLNNLWKGRLPDCVCPQEHS